MNEFLGPSAVTGTLVVPGKKRRRHGGTPHLSVDELLTVLHGSYVSTAYLVDRMVQTRGAFRPEQLPPEHDAAFQRVREILEKAGKL